MKERVSRGKFRLNFSTDEESENSRQTEIGGTSGTTETGNFNKPGSYIPETDERALSVRMTTNPDLYGEPEMSFPRNDEISMEIVLEEGRQAAREHHVQQPPKNANADKTARKHPLANLTWRKQQQLKPERMRWHSDVCVWEELELTKGILCQKRLVDGTNSTIRLY